jgi:hypothetical protein
MAKLHLRSQIALQFVVIVGILLFVVISIFGIVSNRSAEENQEKILIQAHDIISAVQKEIVIGSTVLDGYSRKFSIPSKIGGYDYSLYIPVTSNSTLVLNILNNDFTKKIPPIHGQPKPGLNNITKVGGEVYLN